MATEMTPEEIEAVFREYNDAVVRGVPIEQDLAQRMRDAAVGLRGYTRELQQSVDRIKSSSIGLARALKDGESGARIYNSSIEAGADALATFLKPLGPLGRVIGTVVSLGGKLASEINKQTDALFKSYQDLSRFGAGVTTGMEGVMRLSQQMGYTVGELGEFTGVLERSSRELAMLGGTVAEGVKRFGNLTETVNDQREMWRRLGLDVAQQNQAYDGFLRIMTISGRAQRMTDEELVPASQEYLYNLLTMTRLTGQTVEELNATREAFLAQQRFGSVQRDLERRAREATERGDGTAAARFHSMIERNRMIIDAVPKELQTGVADALTGFLGSSEASIQLMRALPEFAQMLASGNFEYGQAMAVAERETGQLLNNFGKTLGAAGGFDNIFGPLIGFVKLEAAFLNATFQERQQLVAEELQQMELGKGGVAAAARIRELQLQTTQNTQSMIGILRGPVTTGMMALATVTGEASTALAQFAGVAERGAGPGPGSRNYLEEAVIGLDSVPPPAVPTSTATPAVPTSTATPAASTTAPATTPAAEAVLDFIRQLQPSQYRTPSPQDQTDVATPATSVPAAAPPPATAATAAPLRPLNVVNVRDVPAFAQGGIASGPTSGYTAVMEGINAVVPLPGGRSIPVEMPGMQQNSQQQMLLTQQMTRLDDLVKETRTNNQLTQRLLKVAQA